MRIIHFILMICCGFVAACSSADPRFPREETLTPELMPLQGITCPVRVEVKHPFLIVHNWKRVDSLFHIYNLTNYELKNSFGVEGEGPDDFVSTWLCHTQIPDFLINDVAKNLVYRFSINEEGQPVLKDMKKPRYIEGAREAAFINDSLYTMHARYLAPSLYLLSFQDELPRKTRQYRNPNIRDYYADPDMGRVYANENRIALCYGWKKQIDFMDVDLNLIKRVKFKFAKPTDINSQDEGDVTASYVYSYFGKRYLYALFFGRSWNEHRGELSRRGTFLEVFDLDGNPVARYRLDGISPSHFVVDEETFTLYGPGEGGEPEDYLLMYKLKGLS